MTRYYLSDKHRVFATGLYHYTGNGDGTYHERIIDWNGKPVDRPPLDSNKPVQLDTEKQWRNIHDRLNAVDWLKVSDGIYLAAQRTPVSRLIKPVPWTNIFKEHIDGLALRSDLNVRKYLLNASILRRSEGYSKIRNTTQGQSNNDPLARNGRYFWEAVDEVSNALIANIRTGNFDNPDWVFQLNRVIAEGFSRGHAGRFGLDLADEYDVSPNSTNSWQVVLDRVRQGKTVDNINELSEAEKDALYLLARTTIENFRLIFAFPFLFIQSTEREDWVLRFVLDAITPGQEPEEEFAFWHIHFPHWHHDLAFAIEQFGTRKGARDWEAIAQTILTNYPTVGNLNPHTAADNLIANALRAAGALNIRLPNFIATMVLAVFEDVQRQVEDTQS